MKYFPDFFVKPCDYVAFGILTGVSMVAKMLE